MSIDASAALWFLPFVVPLCLYTCYTDMARMKITNPTVIALFVVFALVGLIALPFETYLWRYLHLVVVLIAGIALNAGASWAQGMRNSPPPPHPSSISAICVCCWSCSPAF